MPKLTENQFEHAKGNLEDFSSVPAEKQESLLKKSATRWFKEIAEYYNQKTDNPSEEEQEKLDELIGAGIFFTHQFDKIGNKDYVGAVRECLTEYTGLESVDINEAIKDLDAITAVQEEEPEQEEPGQEEPEREELEQGAPGQEEPEQEAPEVQSESRTSSPQKEEENSLFEIKLFDYYRAKNHFESRNPVSRFFSKLAGKIFHVGEYHALSLKEDHLQSEYNVSPETLESQYRALNQKNTLDRFATDEVDYSSVSATDKEVNEFKEKLVQDFAPVNSEKAAQKAEVSQPQVTKQLE